MCASWTPKATVQVGITIEIQILIKYGIFGKESQISTIQMRESTVFSLLIG